MEVASENNLVSKEPKQEQLPMIVEMMADPRKKRLRSDTAGLVNQDSFKDLSFISKNPEDISKQVFIPKEEVVPVVEKVPGFIESYMKKRLRKRTAKAEPNPSEFENPEFEVTGEPEVLDWMILKQPKLREGDKPKP
mmetsp:Transcript_21906/g.34030  ORF Transcript_21906/g.34030 Transcript_21906/m.34030 type:complete len:137 (-) Transcript_21906:368-778(-)